MTILMCHIYPKDLCEGRWLNPLDVSDVVHEITQSVPRYVCVTNCLASRTLCCHSCANERCLVYGYTVQILYGRSFIFMGWNVAVL